MDPFTMVVAIIGIVTLGSVIRSRHARRPGATEQEPGEARRLREEVRTLKERVAVLERLITDERGSRDLSREIEALRSRDG